MTEENINEIGKVINELLKEDPALKEYASNFVKNGLNKEKKESAEALIFKQLENHQDLVRFLKDGYQIDKRKFFEELTLATANRELSVVLALLLVQTFKEEKEFFKELLREITKNEYLNNDLAALVSSNIFYDAFKTHMIKNREKTIKKDN